MFHVCAVHTISATCVCVAILSAQLARYVDSSGVHRVQGGPNLKATQYYPRLFGHTVAQLWEQHHGDIKLAIKNKMPLICARGANKGEMAYLYYNLLESMVALYGKMCFRRFSMSAPICIAQHISQRCHTFAEGKSLKPVLIL